MALDRIWKFPLQVLDRQWVRMPVNYSVLSVGLDAAGAICLWAAVDSACDERNVEIKIIGGKPLPHVGDFIGTVTEGPFVWHVFTGPSDSANKQTGFHYLTRENG